LSTGLEQQLDERDGLVARRRHLPAALKSKQLLELVDDDQDVVAARHVGLSNGVDQAALTAPERGIHQHADGRIRRLRTVTPTTFQGARASTVQTLTFLAYDVPVAIAAPPAAQVFNAS